MTRTRTLGSELKAKRTELGFTVRGLARAVDVAPSTILRLEADEWKPAPELIKRLARALKLKAEELEALANTNLPRFAPYLRAKYDLSDEAIAELEAHFKAVSRQRRTRSQP